MIHAIRDLMAGDDPTMLIGFAKPQRLAS